jgi:hypothetical protein
VSIGIVASSAVSGGGAGFSPSDVAGLAGWWDVSQETVLSNGATQSTLTDRSGNGITLTATGTPEYRTDLALNPTVYMAPNTTPERFAAASAADLDLTGDFLIIGAFYVNTASRGGASQNTFVSKNFSRYEMYEYQSTFACYVGGTSNNAESGSGEIVSSTAYILAARRTSTNALSVRKDGDQVGTSANSASATGTYAFTVGLRAGTTNASLGLDAALSELIVYDADVSASDLAALETYLSNKWGITI